MYRSIRPDAVPAFPDGGGAVLHRVQPAGGRILQQQAVRRVCMAVVGKDTAQERCGKKSGIQVVIILRNQFCQAVCRDLCFPGVQQSKGNGTDIFCLAFGGNYAIFGAGMAVSIPGSLRDLAVSPGILLFPEDAGDF